MDLRPDKVQTMNPTQIVNLSKQEALGMYRLIVRKYSASRWSYRIHNPQGGSFGTGAFKTQRDAIVQGLRGVPAGTEVLVTCAVWDATCGDYGDYGITKQFTLTKE